MLLLYIYLERNTMVYQGWAGGSLFQVQAVRVGNCLVIWHLEGQWKG